MPLTHIQKTFTATRRKIQFTWGKIVWSWKWGFANIQWALGLQRHAHNIMRKESVLSLHHLHKDATLCIYWTVLFICVSSAHILSNKVSISIGMQIWYSLSLMLLHGEGEKEEEREAGGKQDLCPLTHIVHRSLLENGAVMTFPFPNLWYCDSYPSPSHRVASGRDNMLDFSAFEVSSLAFHCVLSVASNPTSKNKSWPRLKDYKYAILFWLFCFILTYIDLREEGN